MDIGDLRVLYFHTFPLIITFRMPVCSFYTIFHGGAVSRARNKLQFISLLSFSLYRFIIIARAIQCLQREGRQIRFRGDACWKSAFSMKKRGNPWEGCDHQVIRIPQLLRSAHIAGGNCLVNLFEWFSSDFFFCTSHIRYTCSRQYW